MNHHCETRCAKNSENSTIIFNVLVVLGLSTEVNTNVWVVLQEMADWQWADGDEEIDEEEEFSAPVSLASI